MIKCFEKNLDFNGFDPWISELEFQSFSTVPYHPTSTFDAATLT